MAAGLCTYAEFLQHQGLAYKIEKSSYSKIFGSCWKMGGFCHMNFFTVIFPRSYKAIRTTGNVFCQWRKDGPHVDLLLVLYAADVLLSSYNDNGVATNLVKNCLSSSIDQNSSSPNRRAAQVSIEIRIGGCAVDGTAKANTGVWEPTTWSINAANTVTLLRHRKDTPGTNNCMY